MAGALLSTAWEKFRDYAWEKLKDCAWENFKHYAGQELSMFADAPRELEKLSSTFQSIQAVLDDAESRQASDKSVKQWLSRLSHVAYDIEDLVEDRRISGLGDEEGNEDDGNCRKKARLSFSFAYSLRDHVVYRFKVARDIKEIQERLDQIDKEKNRFGFSRNTQGGDQRELVQSQRRTTSLMDKPEMIIGREHDKELMISKLLSGSSHEDGGQAHIVAICGIGGLGKTTLARKIYNDGRVQGHFNGDLYWVCVSEVFDEIRLTKAIIEQVKMGSNSLLELDTLQKELLEALRGKRFLLVLDDVWNDDAEKWEMLRLSLKSGAHGSRILVTTRSQKVTNTMNSTYTHELTGLSDDGSWEIFRSRAFAGRTSEEYSKLENVGREIVRKCRGVPLALTVMGSAMNSKRTMVDWQNISDSKMWSLRDPQKKILPALWLSYVNLPRQLKQCFAYCSMFPKNWVLEKDVLVRLWVAQGFIWSEGNRDMEDIGADYFDDLVAWSIFQEVEKNSKGEITCKMHDLLHDLADVIAKDEIYTFISNSKGGKSEECPTASSNDFRHAFLSFADNDDKCSKIPIAACRAKKLRTLWLDGTIDGGITGVIDNLFHEARFLRALYFFSSTMLPKSIGKLKHLRYLDLSDSNIVELPESVSDLRNLHTLNLRNCENLEKLPKGIGRMVSLRHLEIEGRNRLKYLPKGLGKISGLQSLSMFIVGGGDEGEGCGIDELQLLNSLQGSLQILHLERVSSREEAEAAELWKKQYLCSLVLEISEERDNDAGTERIDSILEGLRPHGNLEELHLEGCTSSKLPSWMDTMPYLQKLVLRYGPKLERVPYLPSLKEFEIEGVRNEILPDEGWERLVALKKLKIYYCKELKHLPEGLMQLQSLEHLNVDGCDRLE